MQNSVNLYIDVHCHLTGDEYDAVGGVNQTVRRAVECGVGRMICSGFDLQSSLQAKDLAEKHEEVYFCVGFHPSELSKYTDGDLERMENLCRHEKCVAVGEIGLDYHFDDNPPKDVQRQMFFAQMQLADRLGLPIVVHSRDAAADTLEFLQTNAHLLKKGGLMHCYSYSAEMLSAFCDLGLYVSFGGPCTFKNAAKVQECVRCVPAHRLLTETDCPYLAPVPLRGTFPNQPQNVTHIARQISAIREQNEQELKEQVMNNAKRLFFKMK